MANMNKAEAALTYASWGWHVIPVVPNGKIPATLHGVKDATTNQEQIAKWWAQNPDYNIGIAAGERSGIIVFDIDPRNGGNDSWDKWTQDNGAVPDGAMQLTAGGGMHYLADYSPEIRSCKLTDGVDLLADGRYFVAYPSTIEGRSYEWEGSSDPFDGVAPFKVPAKWQQAYSALRKPAARIQQTAGGLIQGGRNNGLTALGGAMRHYGMTEAEIMAALSIANETRCEIPLPSSELSHIVRSVCRYEPDTDIAASVAMGTEAAEALLAATQAAVTQEYYFTRATSYLSQPAPLKWVIKHWVPDMGVTMVYGESGCGKTFVTLDMACHIAAGFDWCGNRTKAGIVVYMAGEGNYGIRQRVAAWCKAHDVHTLDNLLISNKAIDLDSTTAAAQIIGAVRELTQDDAAMVFIDTVNNHMVGDENSAQDTRKMLNATQIVARALNAGVCLNHHVGVSSEAKTRARGSSAWRASLDAQVLITKKDGLMEITCTKMKDTEEPQPFFGKLEPVPLGWIDEDGEEIKGAVFALENAPVIKESKKESDCAKDIRKFINAWKIVKELKDDMPYLTKSALVNYLVTVEGLTDATAQTYVKPSKEGRLIYNLLNAEIIKTYSHGWVVSDEVTASTMMLQIS